MTKVSVIIPVYNAAKFLKRCLDSIVYQDYSNLEVWLINDGSKDDSGSICEEYCRLYANFNVVHVENGGVSNARNIGIDLSTGEYILFVDADDYVSSNYVSVLSCPDIDFSICGCIILQENKPEKIDSLKLDNIDISKLALNQKIEMILNHHLVRPVWGKLFRRDIIVANKILFDSSIRLGEDTLFVLEYLKFVKEVQLNDDANYYYFRDSFKINKFRNHPNDFMIVYSRLYTIAEELDQIGYKTKTLHYSNYKSLCMNLLMLLYLSGKFSYKHRKKYFEEFQSINKTERYTDFGARNKFLTFIYKVSLLTKSFFLVDFALKNYFILLKRKNQNT